MRALRLFLLIAGGALSAHAALTTVTDVVHNAAGGFCSGTIGLSWPQSIDAATGNTVYAGSTSVKVATNGTFSVNLVWGSIVFTGTTTINSATVTAANTSNLAVGQTIVASGIPALPATTIVSIITNTSITLSAKATASATVSMTSLAGGGVYTANYNLTPSSCAISTEQWLVPVSASPVGLAAVRTVMSPPPPSLNFIGYGAFSFALVPPSWLTATGSPIIDTGTVTLTPTTAQTSHRVIGTCGTATTFAPCALVAGDIPAISLTTGVTGILPQANGGTGFASSTAYAVLLGGNTSTGPFQQVSGVGTSGQVLTSNGAAARPTWQNSAAAGANAALSNLSAVSINQPLTPQTTLSLGSSSNPWEFLYLYGAGTFGSNNLKFTGTFTGARTITFPDSSGIALTTAAAVTVGQGGTGIASGASGGIPYFASTSTIASSAALTASLPVFGGGAGAAPVSGTRSGNTTEVVTTTGAQTSGNCVTIDANGNHVAAGSACGSGGGGSSILGQSFVDTVETTTSTSYVDLATADSVTFTLSATTNVIIQYSAANYSFAGCQFYNQANIDGTLVGGNDQANSLVIAAPNNIITMSYGWLASLAAGTHTVKIQHKVSANTGQWQGRLLTVLGGT